MITLTAFGVDIYALRDNMHPIGKSFCFLLGEVSPSELPTATNRRYHREAAIVHNTLNKIITERGANPGGAHPDLLQALLDASASETDPIAPEMLIDNVVMFFFGGYDTTSTGMGYTLCLLAAYPDVQAKAVAEIDAVVGRDGKIKYEVLQNLPYLNAVLTESLRLFPPLPATMRNLETDLDIGGYTVAAETTVFLSIWCINWSRLNWGNDVLEFKPECHLTTDANDEQMSAKDRAYRFMTFSGGPRNCVGMRFATLESTCMLVSILQQCVLTRPKDAPPIQPKLVGIVQKPELGVWLHVAPRPTPRYA
ncbi:hypothetical protein SDRG_14108 [Saprolegnia diclina VS20]|uniref:Cytochrome P450 n=1 Tax=Saprolegnia diclina (strain VS20) TaxID=1156394 RepID=T0Q0S3_SAPDV|nr:hypothetical protein SDRG_14108 [Saprolegnia diclina VS20]EQC28151.1 hypothetical protein SDRG_14108 [Saprolegnia diclina VS20]|eukprot:XP_008618437.1 hypothetical protein SDRG_14108 [Saprolegnia diclina VS20]